MRWEVLDATGSPDYVVKAPVVVVGQTVWAVETDGLGVPYVVKLRVRAAG